MKYTEQMKHDRKVRKHNEKIRKLKTRLMKPFGNRYIGHDTTSYDAPYIRTR